MGDPGPGLNPSTTKRRRSRPGRGGLGRCQMTNLNYAWGAIGVIVLASTAGDVLLSRAMKQVGDVHELWERTGLWTVVGRVISNPNFLLGILAMAVAFFSLLFGLSWGDVSLVVPASASLT